MPSSEDSNRADVLVIGAGVVGTACAYFLARAGRSVLLVERNWVAGGTSSACQSNLGPSIGVLENPVYWRAAIETYDRLRAEGFGFGYSRTGGIVFAVSDDEADRLSSEVRELREGGESIRLLSPTEVGELEPGLIDALPAVALDADTAQVNPMLVALELSQAAVRLGARLVAGSAVTMLRADGPHAWRVGTGTGELLAEHLVIAAGTWSREIAEMIGVRLPIWPRKGHIIVTEPQPGLLRNVLFEYGYEASLGGGFAAAKGSPAADGPPSSTPEVGSVIQPLPSGQILVGNSREYAGFHREVSRERLRQIAARAIRFVPRLQSVRAIRTYAGLRPWSPDGRPLIGSLHERPGVLVAAGHGGGGITGGPLAGRTIADILMGRPAAIPLANVDPDRFGPAMYGREERLS